MQRRRFQRLSAHLTPAPRPYSTQKPQLRQYDPPPEEEPYGG